MRTPATKAVAEHRKRLRQRGLARIEVRVPQEDAPLLRDIAAALADPTQAPQMRLVLRQQVNPYAGIGLKELLAAAPLDLEMDFERDPDTGRDIEF